MIQRNRRQAMNKERGASYWIFNGGIDEEVNFNVSEEVPATGSTQIAICRLGKAFPLDPKDDVRIFWKATDERKAVKVKRFSGDGVGGAVGADF